MNKQGRLGDLIYHLDGFFMDFFDFIKILRLRY